MKNEARRIPMTSDQRLTRALPFILTIGGILGLISSFTLSYDVYQIAKNPRFIPACNLNPTISCGNVVTSWQGNIFGFPNEWIGLISFTAILFVGVALLAGAQFARWFWVGFGVMVTAGLAFAMWMLWESVYRIQALCPFCLSIDAITLVIFWYLILYLLREGHILLPKHLIGIADFARRYHLEIVVTSILLIAAAIICHFWYYYGQYI